MAGSASVRARESLQRWWCVSKREGGEGSARICDLVRVKRPTFSTSLRSPQEAREIVSILLSGHQLNRTREYTEFMGALGRQQLWQESLMLLSQRVAPPRCCCLLHAGSAASPREREIWHWHPPILVCQWHV